MSSRLWVGLASALLVMALGFEAGAGTGLRPPIPLDTLGARLDPGYHHAFPLETANPLARQARAAALTAGALRTLPTWTQTFDIAGVGYRAHLVGTSPTFGGATVIPTVIVPIRLIISDYSANGKTPLALDGTRVMPSVLASPFFNAAAYASGDRQFIDGMLHTDFPKAAASWSVTFAPTVARRLTIVAPAKTTTVYQDKSGAFLAVVNDDNVIDTAITNALAAYPPDTLVIFVTYNALEHDAFGYHYFNYTAGNKGAVVYLYTSWLLGVDDAFSIPSPDAATLAHEIAEVTYDPVITSFTRRWGDAFGGNRCFQGAIEVGDAIEDAPAHIQLATQAVTVGGATATYTVQNEALLTWFERQTPSSALGGAYSFPSAKALTAAAPLDCVK